LPEDKDALALVARRMPASLIGDDARGEQLLRVLNEHLEHVQEIYTRVIHAHQAPSYLAPAPVVATAGAVAAEDAPAAMVEAPASNLMRFLEQKAPAFAQAASRAKLGGPRPPSSIFWSG